jgi:5-methylthioadenosine/S-adenosylhomocysteine deaminase
MPVIYSGRWVLPIASPAIDFGAVAVDGDKIVSVGNLRDVTSEFPHALVIDFGASAILPGLINAHSHLELTAMRGFLEREEHDFKAWLGKLTLARMAMAADDLFVSAACGGMEAVRAGITCVGDSSSAAGSAMKALREVGLRGIVYQESFGPDPDVAEEAVAGVRRELDAMRAIETAMVHAGVSPHAPYTVSARQLRLIARLAIEEKLPLMMHAAESQAEKSLLLDGTGPFAEGLRIRNIAWQAPGISTIQYLARHGIMETQPLLAHCITIDEEDMEMISRARAAVAHCPKSNAKLGHGRAPFEKLIGGGLKVGLGSDSVASNNNCDILEEGRFALLSSRGSRTSAGATLNAETVLFAMTLGGAHALGLGDQVGSLERGKQADLTVVRLDGVHQHPVTNPVDGLIFSSSGRDVRMTMVAGKEVFRDGVITTVDQAELSSRLTTVREKLEQAAKQQ